jgi:hypothetical protein
MTSRLREIDHDGGKEEQRQSASEPPVVFLDRAEHSELLANRTHRLSLTVGVAGPVTVEQEPLERPEQPGGAAGDAFEPHEPMCEREAAALAASCCSARSRLPLRVHPQSLMLAVLVAFSTLVGHTSRHGDARDSVCAKQRSCGRVSGRGNG